MGDEVDFLPSVKHKSFLQYCFITLGVHSWLTQSIQNNKFLIFLQYLQENVKDEVDYLPADKHQRFLQKEVRDEVDFLHAGKHQTFLQIDFNTLGINVFCKGMIKHL